MKEKILELRAQGKSYSEIKNELGCSIGTIAYHCGEGQQEKTKNRLRKNRSANSLLQKTQRFIEKSLRGKSTSFQNHRGLRKTNSVVYEFGYREVLEKIGDNPKCYLTGEKIDLTRPYDYHLDHIIPVSKGGDGSLNNLGISTRDANQSKHDMSVEEYLVLCKKVLEYNGYKVNKIEE